MRLTSEMSRSCVAMAALVAMLGCSSAPPEKRGASLSEASKEAAKGKEEKKKVLKTAPPEVQGSPGPVAVVGAAGEALVADSTSSTPEPARPSGESEDILFVSLMGGFGA